MALLEAFRGALSQLGLKGKLVAADITSASPAFHAADVGVTVPTAGRIEYIPALLDIVRKHKISLLVPLTDLDLRSIARQRKRFSDLNCTPMIGSEPAITLCRDKARTNAMLGEMNLATINTLTLKEFMAHQFYPCFIKPIRGSASVGTGMIANQRELRAHIATFGELLLVQEYVPGREYTIDVYRDRGGVVRSVVPRQRLMVRSGEVEKGVTVKDEQLIETATKLASCLGDLWGVFCCQCRRTEGSMPRFFEINPRFGGGVTLAIAAGANMPLYLLEEVTGRKISAKVGQFTENLVMLRYDQAIYVKTDDPESLPGFKAPYFR